MYNPRCIETLDDLKMLVASGDFHHVTARTIGIPMLWIYASVDGGFRGYALVGSIPDNQENHDYLISINHGVSVGAYGAG